MKGETATAAGRTIELTIDRLGFGGDGVARHEGKVVFVPRSAPGDRLRVRIVREQKRFDFAAIEEILSPSPLRAAPPCPAYQSCGGCHLQHLPYPEQLAHKRAMLVEALQRIGKIKNPPVAETVAAPATAGYRNKAYFHLAATADGLRLGLKDIAGATLTDLRQCLIVHPAIAAAYQRLRRRLFETWEKQGALPLCAVCLRYSESQRRGLLILIAPPHRSREVQALAKDLTLPDFEAVLNLKEERDRDMFGPAFFPLAGAGKLTEEVNGYRYPLDAAAFFQVNSAMAGRLQEIALELLAPAAPEVAADLYCGGGFFSLPLARRCARVLGIEISRPATLAAAEAAAQNGIANAEFSTGRAARMFLKARRRGFQPDIALADPPRGGLEKDLWPLLLDRPLRRLVYISCSPPTLARDAQKLCAGGWRLEKVVPLDLFPQTYHVEAAGLFCRY